MTAPRLLPVLGLLAALFSLAPITTAEAPVGSVGSSTFSGPGEGVFDFESHRFDEDFINDEGETLWIWWPAFIRLDAAGKISSRGPTRIHIEQDGEMDFPATYSTSGAMTSSKGRAQFTGKASASGTAFLEGRNRKVSVSVTYKFLIDPLTQTISGSKSGKASASGLGSIPLQDRTIHGSVADPDYFESLDWKLVMNLQTSRTKVTGIGSVTTTNGRTFPCTVKGTYSTKTDISKLTVTGTGTGKGVKLTVYLTGNDLTRVTGTLIGQKVNVLD